MSSDDWVPNKRPGVPGGARDRNRKKRVTALNDAALELFLAKGASAVTVDALAKAAKMAKGSFYRYAASKEDLVARLIAPLDEGLEAAFSRCQRGLEEARHADLPVIYMRLAADLTVMVREHPDLVRLYLQESRAPGAAPAILSLARSIREGAVALTELARERGLLGKVPAWLSAAVVVGAAEELLLDHLGSGEVRDAAEVQRALVAMVLGGISSWELDSR